MDDLLLVNTSPVLVPTEVGAVLKGDIGGVEVRASVLTRLELDLGEPPTA